MTQKKSSLAAIGLIASGVAACSLASGAMAMETRYVVRDQTLHSIDPRLFGQFMEKPSWGGETGPEGALVKGTGRLQPSVLEIIRRMKIPVLRFPGGTDVERTDWRDMVSNVPGRTPERPMSVGQLGDKVTNNFGYDEFLQLSEELGSEVIIVVNLSDALMRYRPLEEAATRAAELVAYCNAPVGAKLPPGMADWPSVRAKNGREKPYNVKLWQIGNEAWAYWPALKPPEGVSPARYYADCVAAYIKAMQAVDPSIRFIADMCGTTVPGGELVKKDFGDTVPFLASHSYMPKKINKIFTADEKHVPTEQVTAADIWNAWVAVPAFDTDGLAILPKDMTDPARRIGAKLAVTEWNWNGHWGNEEIRSKAALDSLWAKGVGAAGYLHGLMRAGDVVQIGCQSMLVGISWDIAAIQADPSGEKPARLRPTGLMTMFYSQHHGYRLLAMESENVPTYAQPYIMRVLSPAAKVAVVDALASRSDSAIFFHAINRSFDKPADVVIDLGAFKGIAETGKLYLVEGRLNNKPKPGEPSEIGRVSERAAACEKGIVRVILPARSVACVEFRIE